MLKIKNNVDLKELEKFGFIEDDEYILDGKSTRLISSDNWIEIELYDELEDKWNSRKIYSLSSGYLDSIYDLIKADLVEKVKE